MAENPLLPHRKLRELHALMLRCRELDRKDRTRRGAREALLAATTLHLQAGDVLCGSAGDRMLETLAPPGKTKKLPGYLAIPNAQRLLACAGIAGGLKAASTDGVVLAFAQAGEADPGWKDALTWAHQAQLPLILACADHTGGAAPRKHGKLAEAPLTWTALSQMAARIKLPIVTVDGEDAVAVYRVMQESVIRARFGGGAALIWAVGSRSGEILPRSRQPLARLESYLRVRGIKLKAKA